MSGVVLSAGGSLLYTLRRVPMELYNRLKSKLIYTVKIYQYDELFYMLEQWMYDNYSHKYNSVEASVSLKVDESYPGVVDETHKQVFYKQEETLMFIRYAGRSIMVQKEKEKADHAQSLKDRYMASFSISGIRCKKQINKLLDDVLQDGIQKSKNGTTKIYSWSAYEWELAHTTKVKPFDRVVLKADLKQKVLKDLDRFVSSAEWYASTCLPYRRGYILHGPPGTGKTTMALAIAAYCDRNVYTLNINGLEDDAALTRAMMRMHSDSLLLIEDIDAAFNGRESVNKKISFSTLLNCMDGAMAHHNTIVVITTNKIHQLDAALLRPGRADMVIEVPNPTETEVSEYLSLFYDTDVHITSGTLKADTSMAQVQETCIRHREDIEGCKKELTTKQVKQLCLLELQDA